MDSALNEGLGRYYTCRLNADEYYWDASFDTSGNSTNIDTGFTHVGDNPTPKSPYRPTNYDEFYTPQNHPEMDPDVLTSYNAWIAASTLWDVVKREKPSGAGAGIWPPGPGWNDILWTALGSYAPQTMQELHLDLETMAYWWEKEEDADGDGLRDAIDWRLHAHSQFYWHKFPDHQFPLAPPGLPAPALQRLDGDPALVSVGNFPNPFNPETWIAFQLNTPADVTITVYSATGRTVRVLELGSLARGSYDDREHAAYWDGRIATGESAASGVYLYEIRAGDETVTRKMLLAK